MTHTDPNADAFVRRILSNPVDPVPRLVFADWLEESGTSSNLAWARFLRLADELANAPPDDPRRPKMATELGKVGSLIRAKLTCRAEVVVAYPDEMLQLLPPRNLVVKLDTVTLPREVLEFIPESVARESPALPLARLTDRTVVLAATEPPAGVVEQLEFILNCRVAFVGVANSDLTPCLDRNYGPSETESIDSVHYLWAPDDGLRRDSPQPVYGPALAFWNHVILDAGLYSVTAVEVEIDARQVTVWHHFREGRRRHELHTPALSEGTVARLVAVLRAFLRIPIVNVEGTIAGEITVVFWGRPRTHTVHITERPNGHSVLISIPPYPIGPVTALAPAA